MSAYQFTKMLAGLLTVLMLMTLSSRGVAATENIGITRYLAFQIFTGSLSPNVALGTTGANPLPPPPPKSAIKQVVQDIIENIGTTGDRRTKLAFVIGPLALDHSDAQLQQMIQDAFEIAVELNVAVGFHIDDSMFWAQRSDLWRDPLNVEWLDWEGTPNTGRRIDWGPQPTKLAPQMCYNSPAIQVEISRLATQVIGDAIRIGIDRLETLGHPELFAGVIVGWETQIGQDFDTNQLLGYCALSNRGFSQANPPPDLDSEREQVAQAFIELWAMGITQAGIDPGKIYSHSAFVPRSQFEQLNRPDLTYSQANHFAPPEVSFGSNYHPGFSTYPQFGLMEQLYDALQMRGSPAWASAEGSTIAPSILESVVDTETYLGWMFNHGAALVTIFGWGVGSKGENPFWNAADTPDAIDAYRKFLSGESLTETTTDMAASIGGSLPAKIQQIQADLPGWMQNHPTRQSEIEPLVRQLDQALRENRLEDVQDIADAILRLIGQ
ncbi:MAG: hypothetical protein ABI835_08595 [Chloroflexota bacterium]